MRVTAASSPASSSARRARTRTATSCMRRFSTRSERRPPPWAHAVRNPDRATVIKRRVRSEEHTSELQSRLHLVCRLLLEKKKKTQARRIYSLDQLVHE